MLLIFIKNPRLGHVKTRLAATVGDSKALEIYRYLLAQTQVTAAAVDERRRLFYSEHIPEADEWPVQQFEKRLQHPGDLGERMHEAFRSAFADGAKRAVIIGSDCPDLTPALLRNAFEQLNNHDLVVGPASDGGYYLLGMTSLWPSLFEGIDWSTRHVLSQTLTQAKELNLQPFLLPTLTDIDEAVDWTDYLRRHPDAFI